MFSAKLYQIFNKYKNTFAIKNRIAKNKVVSITIRPIIFFKSIIGLIKILGGEGALIFVD